MMAGHWCDHKPLSLVLMLIALGCAEAVAQDSDPLADMRLFFTAEQRAETRTAEPGPDQQPDALQEIDSQHLGDQPSERSRRAPTNKLATGNAAPVVFTALVSRDSSVHVIVNDLPCRPVDMTGSDAGRRGAPVVCQHLISDDFKLRLLMDSSRLLVLRSGRQIASLKVGQSL